MPKLMTKSELIEKITAEHSDKLTKKDVKGVMETLATIGYKEPVSYTHLTLPTNREV